MRGRTSIFAVLTAILMIALTIAPVATAKGSKGNSRGSAESKTSADNGSKGSRGNSQGAPESKTDKDNNSKGSTGSETTNDDESSDDASAKGSKGSKGSNGSSEGKSGKGGPKSPIPGNNGTIKIDGEPFDTTRNNEPHVGCTFRVLYFGTDEEEGLTSTLTFEAHAPTSGDFTFTDTVTIGAAEPDIAGPYNLVEGLQAAGIEPHPQQGYHVKLTTNTEYSQGADVKHKVFWIQCDEASTEVAGASISGDDDEDKVCVDGEMVEGATESEGCEHLAPAGSTDGETTVLGAGLSRGGDSDVLGGAAERGPTVAGESAERADVAGGILPFTGGDVVAYFLAGLALIAAGFAFLRLRRGRQTV